MKKVFLNYLVIAALAGAAAFTSCDDDDKDKKTFTVKFNSNGGTDVSDKTVKEGEKISKPSPDPTRSEYTFDAWYKEAGLTTEWIFDTDKVTADLTLYAKWNTEASGSGRLSPPEWIQGAWEGFNIVSITYTFTSDDILLYTSSFKNHGEHGKEKIKTDEIYLLTLNEDRPSTPTAYYHFKKGDGTYISYSAFADGSNSVRLNKK